LTWRNYRAEWKTDHSGGAKELTPIVLSHGANTFHSAKTESRGTKERQTKRGGKHESYPGLEQQRGEWKEKESTMRGDEKSALFTGCDLRGLDNYREKEAIGEVRKLALPARRYCLREGLRKVPFARQGTRKQEIDLT